MKRIKNADINFKVNPKRINLNDFSIKFYTVNSEAYFFTKDQNNLVSVERDATIYDEDVIISGGTKVLDYYLPLDWSELVQLGEGVLNYRCINNIEDPFFPDMTYNKVVEDTTAYYIDSDIIVDPSINRNIIERVTELESGLAVESIDREEADTFISGAVDTEVARAISAETELSERINELESGTSEALDAEIARAEAAEAAIRQDLTDESEIRSSADTAIWTSVNAEITRSTSADTALDNKIDVETLRAIGVENSISGNLETYKATNNAALQAETTRATSAETSLGNAIEDEVTARENADSSLTARIDNLEASFLEEIDAEEARAKEAESGITIALNNEVSRATNAETIIANSLNSEITRATSAETSLNNQIDAEVLRATAAEASLEAKIGLVSGATELINAETARAVTAENTLSGAIDSVSAATSGSVEQLDAKIDQEIADRTADVDAEETRAKGVENALSGAIDSLDVRFFDDAKYEDSGNTKVINFYNGNVVKATIDCTDFLVDGMIDDVRIENGYLVIDFNTASGKQDIRIPLTDIFNPANYYTKSETSGATEIANALAQKLSISDFNAYSGTVDTLINSKASQSDLDTLNGVVTEHIADATVHVTASDKTKWNKVDEKADTTAVTAAIDAAVSGKANSSDVYLKSETSGKTEIANALAQKLAISDFSTYSAATNSRLAEDEEVTAAAFNELNEALSGKVATSTYNTYTAATATALANKQNTLVAGENITISGNVISAEGGGGKAVTGGTNISITTGETADTINCTLPLILEGQTIKTADAISLFKTSGSLYVGFNSVGSAYHSSFCLGRGSNTYAVKTIAAGDTCTANKEASQAFGKGVVAKNFAEHSVGQYNVSSSGSSTFGDSGNTLFSVGNGTSPAARHNAFEVRQNGDIYLSSGGTDIKLQDHLGGGGSITVDSALDSGSTNPVENQALWDELRLGGAGLVETTIEWSGNDSTNYPTGSTEIKLEFTSECDADINFLTENGEQLGNVSIQYHPQWSLVNVDNTRFEGSSYEISGSTITISYPTVTNVAKLNTTNIYNYATVKAIYNDPLIVLKDQVTGNTAAIKTKVDTTTFNSYASSVDSALGGKLNISDYVVDSALNVASRNPVQNQALYSELRIDNGGGETETTLTFDEGQYSTNYPQGCTKIKVEVVGSSNWSTIDFHNDDQIFGNITINNWGSISVNNSFEGATYEISGTTVIISYPTVTNVTKIRITGGGNYVYKAITSSTTPLKNQVVANTAALANKQDTLIAGENITISGNVISAQGGGSSYTAGAGIDISNNVISVTGKTNQSDFTGHTTNTSIHVTTAEKAVWNGKSDFSGSYNDLTDKPTIPTVPTSNTAFTNDAGYITANDITGKTDVTAFTAHTGDTTIHVTSSDKTSWNGAVTNASNAVTALGGLKLVKLSQSAYDNLQTKDNNTLYVIVG